MLDFLNINVSCGSFFFFLLYALKLPYNNCYRTDTPPFINIQICSMPGCTPSRSRTGPIWLLFSAQVKCLTSDVTRGKAGKLFLDGTVCSIRCLIYAPSKMPRCVQDNSYVDNCDDRSCRPSSLCGCYMIHFNIFIGSYVYFGNVEGFVSNFDAADEMLVYFVPADGALCYQCHYAEAFATIKIV